jgi:hypothetical protein
MSGIFCDIGEGFDHVNHSILITKLAYGREGNASK